MIASFVGFLTIILNVWLWRTESRGWLKKLGLAAFLAVVAQGVLGGLTVLYFLPTPVSVGHACLAQLFFTMTVSIAFFTSAAWKRQAAEHRERGLDEGLPPLRQLGIGANLIILTQLALGAAFRHKGFGIEPHLVGAAVTALIVIWILARVTARFASDRPLMRWALLLNGLVMMQLALGGATYWVRAATESSPQPLLPMVAITVAHVATGAMILAVSVLFTIQSHARTRRRSGGVEQPNLATSS
jgi:cytochrome c oxidase assembly protein subunit 15